MPVKGIMVGLFLELSIGQVVTLIIRGQTGDVCDPALIIAT